MKSWIMDKFKEKIDTMRTYWSPDDEVQNDLTDLLEMYGSVDQDAYERGYKFGYDKGYLDGDFVGKIHGIGVGRIEIVKKIKQFMLETFGGDDGTGNLNKIYEYLDELEKKEQMNYSEKIR